MRTSFPSPGGPLVDAVGGVSLLLGSLGVSVAGWSELGCPPDGQSSGLVGGVRIVGFFPTPFWGLNVTTRPQGSMTESAS